MCCDTRGCWTERRRNATSRWDLIPGTTEPIVRVSFFEAGKAERAMDYLRLDATSEWSRNVLPAVLLRANKLEEARRAAGDVSPNPMWLRSTLESCLAPGNTGDLEQTAGPLMPTLLGQRDPEMRYYEGSLLAYCGAKKSAIQLIKSAIDGKYCAAQALQEDPLLKSIRGEPEYRCCDWHPILANRTSHRQYGEGGHGSHGYVAEFRGNP